MNSVSKTNPTGRPAFIGLVVLVFASITVAQFFCQPPIPRGWLAFQLPVCFTVSPTTWTAGERELVCFGLGLDFLYLAVYPYLLSLLCTRAARSWPSSSRIALACRFAGIVVWAAPPADVAENILLFLWLRGTWCNAHVITVVAGLKWLAILFPLFVGLIGLLLVAVRRSKVEVVNRR